MYKVSNLFDRFFRYALAVCCIVYVPSLIANTASDYQVSRETVERTMANLVETLQETTFPEDPDEKKEKIKQLIEQNLDPVVDFKLIVKRIMGKYFKNASKEQRNAFLDAFRESLVNTYGSYLINSDLKEIASKLSYAVLPLGKQKKEGIASVTSNITFESTTVEIVFSMYYNNKEDKWKMQNMIVEGINLGINYRTQFDRLMNAHKGDVDKVIAEWSIADS